MTHRAPGPGASARPCLLALAGLLCASLLQAAEPGPVAAPPAAAAALAVAQPEDYEPLLRAALDAHGRGDDETALRAYERVLGRADAPREQVRALIGIAMLRLLPSSTVHDDEASALVLDELQRRIRERGLEQEFFGDIELLRRLAAQDGEQRALRAENARLHRELKQKDDVIRQLRALTVGN